jgi:hypothetical protein
MPREIRTVDDPNTVFRLARERQEIEAMFARAVYNVFNSGAALAKLQGVASSILKMMNQGPPQAVDDAIRGEGFLRLWKNIPKGRNGIAMYESPILARKLDASDCADVIRLAGEWVEVGGFGDGSRVRKPTGNTPGTVKDAFRAGGKQVWGPTARVRKDGWDIEPHLKDHMRDQNATFTGMAGVRGHHGKKNSKRAAGSSNVLQLDRLFGLVVACDISGTTADCIFSLELFGGQFGMTAAYYMLPLGTIVHNMHHSVLEVALATSLNKEMDYHIGFFNTLKPSRAKSFPPELAGLQTAIGTADSLMKHFDLHHMRYYEGTKPSGVFQFQGPETIALRNSPISNAVTMLDRAPCLGGYPQRHTVVKLLESGGFIL